MTTLAPEVFTAGARSMAEALKSRLKGPIDAASASELAEIVLSFYMKAQELDARMVASLRRGMSGDLAVPLAEARLELSLSCLDLLTSVAGHISGHTSDRDADLVGAIR